MKKEDLMKIEGMTDDLAAKVAEASAEELKNFIPKTRFDEVNEAKKNAEALVKERDKQLEEEILKAQLTLKEGVESIPSPVMNIIPVTTNGHYAAVNNHDRIFSDSSADIGSVSQRHFSTAFASSAEAATSLTNDYMSMCRQIIDSPGFEIQKALSIIELRLLTAFTAATSGNISERSDLKAIFEILDLNDTRLLLGKHAVMAASALYNHRDILPDCPLTEYYEVIMDKAMLHVLHPGTTQLP